MADGYPNPDGIQNDIDKMEVVLTEGDTIIGYSALLINDEPAYEKLEGQWLYKRRLCCVLIESLQRVIWEKVYNQK
jgi:hypothetical protein